MNENFATLTRHLDRNEIHYQVHDDERLEFRMALENTFATCRMRCDERVCAISVCAAIKVPTGLLGEMGEFIARANFRNIIGRWDLDWDQGHLTFEASVGSVEGVTDAMLPPIIAASLGAMDRYYPAIMRILFGGWSAKDSVAMAEADIPSVAADLAEAEEESRPSPEEGIADPEQDGEFARLMESLTQGLRSIAEDAGGDVPKPKKRRRRRKSDGETPAAGEPGPDTPG